MKEKNKHLSLYHIAMLYCDLNLDFGRLTETLLPEVTTSKTSRDHSISEI